MNETEYERYTVLAEIAELYYLKGFQQAAIAEKMKISRSLVSRMISEAQEKGIVSISINRFFKRSGRLESRLCSRYGLEGAGVLVLPGNLKAIDVKTLLGRFAADLIYDGLDKGANIGFTFGTTLQKAVEALSVKPPKPAACIQLTGSLGAAEAAFDSHELVHLLSSAWNCEGSFLHAPLIVNSPDIRSQLYSSRSNMRNSELCSMLDVGIVGLSSLQGMNSSALYTGGHLSADDMQNMRRAGVIGDVGSFSIDKNGRLVEIEKLTMMIGVSEAEWKKVKKRFGICFGEHKIDVIRAALKGGWLTDLVTDEQTADMLL